MKKILALLLSFALVLGLAACGGKPAGPDASDPGESARGVRTLAAAAYPEMAPYPNEEDYYDVPGCFDKKEARRMDRFTKYAVVAAHVGGLSNTLCGVHTLPAALSLLRY